MALDASIYGMIRPQQQGPGPLEQYAQIAQVKNMMGEGRLQDLRAQQVEQQMAAAPAMNARAQQEADLKADQEYFKTMTPKLRDMLAGVKDNNALAAFRDASIQFAGMFRTPQYREMLMKAAQQVPSQWTPEWWESNLASADQVITALEKGRDRQVTTRGQDLTAETSRRGQDITAQTATRGQDLTSTTARRGQDITARGQDIGAETARRGQDITADTARAGQDARVEADQAKKSGEVKKTLDMYVSARDGLLVGLGGSDTGPIAGRMPAYTSAQQVAEGGVSAMAPVLKQLFRVAGEGTFTDRDQEMLLNMVPTRADRPAARKAKMENIDRIVAAKLGMEVSAYTSKDQTDKGTIGKGIDPAKLSDDEIRRELGL
jgi:hypothetical protein